MSKSVFISNLIICCLICKLICYELFIVLVLCDILIYFIATKKGIYYHGFDIFSLMVIKLWVECY